MVNRRAIQNGSWDLVVLIEHICSTFNLVTFKVILGHSVCMRLFWKCVFENATTTVTIFLTKVLSVPSA